MQHTQYMKSQTCVSPPSIIPHSLNKEIKSHAHPRYTTQQPNR